MRLCLDFGHQAWSRGNDPRAAVARTIELARTADEAGIDAIWVSEDPDGWDAFALLGALARETSHAVLGTGVTNPYARHPNLLAAAVATLDRLSGGRAALGLGRGQPEWHERALGVDLGSPLAVLEETIDLLRQWWAPPHHASIDGHIQVDDWERTIHPLQSAPPIYLAAAGPKALALAGRIADGVVFNSLTSDTFLDNAIPSVRAAAIEAARDPDRLAFVLWTPVTVTDNPEPILERHKDSLAMINALPGMDRLLVTPGFDVAAIMKKVRHLMRTEAVLAAGGGFPALRRASDLVAARAAIPAELVARLAIVGPLPVVRDRLDRLATLGITHVAVAAPSPRQPLAMLGETIRALRET